MDGLTNCLSQSLFSQIRDLKVSISRSIINQVILWCQVFKLELCSMYKYGFFYPDAKKLLCEGECILPSWYAYLGIWVRIMKQQVWIVVVAVVKVIILQNTHYYNFYYYPPYPAVHNPNPYSQVWWYTTK